MRHFLFNFVFGAFVSLSALCQEDAWTSYTTSDGLPNNSVRIILQDRRGYLWIATQSSISRFDGEQFQHVSLKDSIASDDVVTMFEDDTGKVWFLTRTGIKYYDGETYKALTAADGLADNVVTAALRDRRGWLWLGARNALCLYRAGRIECYTEKTVFGGKQISFLYEDRDKNIWAGFKAGGVVRVSTSDETHPTFQTFSVRDGLPNSVVFDLQEDAHGTLWVATLGGIAKLFSDKFVVSSLNDKLPSRIVYSILAGQGNDLWFRLAGAGVARWDGTSLHVYSTDNGLASKFVNEMLRDVRGNVWFATNEGVSRFSNGSFRTYHQSDGLPSNFVRTIYEDRSGTLWFGTSEGLAKFVEPRFTTYVREEPRLTTSFSTAIYKDKQGNLWFPCEHGIGFTDGTVFRIFTQRDGIPDNSVRGFIETNAGELWAGTQQGVIRFDGKKFQPVENAFIRGKPVTTSQRDSSGNIWFVRDDNVVLRMEGDNITTIDEGPLRGGTFNIEAFVTDVRGGQWFLGIGGAVRMKGDAWIHLPIDSIMPGVNQFVSVSDLDGNMWFGTRKGLTKYDGENIIRFTKEHGLPENEIHQLFRGRKGIVWAALHRRDAKEGREVELGVVRFDGSRFQLFNTQNGLPSNNINSVVDEEDGSTWFLTEAGLCRYDKGGFRTYTHNDGLAGNIANRYWKDTQGNIWIVSESGLSKFNGIRFSSFTVREGLLNNSVTDVEEDREKNVWVRTRAGIQKYMPKQSNPFINIIGIGSGTKALLLRQGIELSYKDNTLAFEYRGIDFLSRSEKLLYVYRLDGYDTTWYGPVRERKAFYHNLSPGSYRFEVKAIDADLNESIVPAEIRFSIVPPFYITWWFLLGATISTVSAVYSGYRIRLKSKLERERVLSELQAARDMQMSLMPREDPVLSGFEISGVCLPAKEVGGDFFDYVWLNPNRTKLGIAVADVSGKAMKAAITAVFTSGILSNGVQNHQRPKEILANINGPLFSRSDKKSFVTLGFCVLDLVSNTLKYSSAGQAAPLLLRRGVVDFIQASGIRLPLGVKENLEYSEVDVELQQGDTVVFYTDGITEAMNSKKELYGNERLAERMKSLQVVSAREVRDMMLEDVRTFADGAPQHDDMTVVVVKVH